MGCDDEADPALADAAEVARALLDGPFDDIGQVRGIGRNSRIYRIRSGDETFALKRYPLAGTDSRERLKTEIEALRLMERHAIAVVPRAIASVPERGYALLSWVEGSAVHAPDATDIDAAAAFAAAIHGLRTVPEAQSQPLGAEACLSGAEIVAQLGRRLARLGEAAASEPGLAMLLDRMSAHLFCTVLPAAIAGYAAANWSFAAPISGQARSLCPSDFGFHNTLRGAFGLVFLDFEYFGWDDPVKLTSDFLLHPGMNLPEPLKRRFLAASLQVYGNDSGFARRLELLYPLFAMRWCLILLNEFLPERWATRRHAGVEIEWQEAKMRQLSRADALFRTVEANEGALPYGF
jgi:hypothetical protein